MKAQTLKRIGTTLIVIGLVGAYCTIATMNNRGGVMTLDFVREAIWCTVMATGTHLRGRAECITYKELESVCGLGTVTGLHGANCYHDYTAFVPGISVRNYTDEELDQMMAEENTPKLYNGKEYTTYEALQEQRRLETLIRKSRQDIVLLKEGGADKKTITLRQCRYRQQQ